MHSLKICNVFERETPRTSIKVRIPGNQSRLHSRKISAAVPGRFPLGWPQSVFVTHIIVLVVKIVFVQFDRRLNIYQP